VREPKIVYQSKHLLALSKPYGMPSQNDPSGDLSLVQWASDHLGREAKLLHRLDRPTGGLVLLGKSAYGTRELSRLFANRDIEKTYLAVTAGSPDFQEIDLEHYIGKLPGKNFVRAYDKQVRLSKVARLKARVLAKNEGLTLLEVLPSTGRRHQIRAQLKAVGLHLLGDFKYGNKAKALPYPGIALWAFRLEFPFGGLTLSLTTKPPDDHPWALFSSHLP
jgi:23S rRNA pseudouridine1911/1915/1917 synthase